MATAVNAWVINMMAIVRAMGDLPDLAELSEL
jgi:hypothetical protein